MLKTTVSGLISNSAICGSILQNASGKPAKFNPDIVLPANPTQQQIDNYRAANTLAKIAVGSLTVASAGATSGSLNIKSIGLLELMTGHRTTVTVNNISAIRVLAELDIAVSKSYAAGRDGVPAMVRLPIIVDLDPSQQFQILACSTVPQNQGSSSGSQQKAQEFSLPLSVLQQQVSPHTLTCSNIIQGPTGQGFNVSLSELKRYFEGVPVFCSSGYSGDGYKNIQVGCSRFCQAKRMNFGTSAECNPTSNSTACFCVKYSEPSHFIANSACKRYCKNVKQFSTGFINECDGTNEVAVCGCIP